MPADRTELARYIRDLADRLGLKDWEYLLSEDPPHDAAWASIEPIEGQKLGVIRLCPDWDNRDDDGRRLTIVHELLHSHQAMALDIVRIDLLKHLAQSTYDVFQVTHRRAMEYANDAVARVLAPLMPSYPSEPKAE
jgi:hypothetical protein